MNSDSDCITIFCSISGLRHRHPIIVSLLASEYENNIGWNFTKTKTKQVPLSRYAICSNVKPDIRSPFLFSLFFYAAHSVVFVLLSLETVFKRETKRLHFFSLFCNSNTKLL